MISSTDNNNNSNISGTSFAEDEATPTPTFTHEDLFTAAEESHISCRPLVNFFYHSNTEDSDEQQLTIRQRRDAICNVVSSCKFNKSRARRLFASLSPLLTKVVDDESYIPDVDSNGTIISDSNATSSLSIKFIKCCAYLVEAYLDGIIKRQRNGRGGLQTLDDEIFEVAEMLHELLFPLDQVGNNFVTMKKMIISVQSAIFTMCEKWWHGNFEDKEQLVTQLIPLLLMRSLDDNAQKNDVKRLYSIREAIDLLDFQDESIESLKMHLLRVVSNPLFLQNVDGRKFIIHLFQVDPTLVVDLHRAVRAQIPGAKKSILNAYAEIYFNAWKLSTEREDTGEEEEGDGEENDGRNTIQISIEENALQDFMYQVIHAAVSSTAKSVRVVLDKFYVNKKNPDVESLLYRMYGPLLWRALSGANARVRMQSSVVLTDTFPLRDPNAREEWTEACVKRSVEALISLMNDDVPAVRVAGSTATAKILSLFWAAVPSQDIRALLNCIIVSHASDSSSSAVRAAAVNAVTALLEEDKSHAVLRPLLSNLGNLIHDKTEKVRLAVLNMLLFVKKLRNMKYYHVVPANHLLARLAEEGRGGNNPQGPVAILLCNLLSNSFFPTGNKKTMSDIIKRTLRLLVDSPDAAVVFYSNAYSQLSINSISKLVSALMKCLCFFIIEEKKANCEDCSNLSISALVPEDESIESKGITSSAISAQATIAESISLLWESIEVDLKDAENEPAVEMLMEVCSGKVLTEVYCHFESKLENKDMADATDCSRACASILNCAAKIDQSKVEGLRDHLVVELTNSNDMSLKANFSTLLVAWGMTDDVAQCLASPIKLYFEGEGSDTHKSKRKQRSKKTSTRAVLPTLDVEMCLGILGHILKGTYPATVKARKSILESDIAFNLIAAALQTAKNGAFDDELSVERTRHMGIAIELFGRLLIHQESMKAEVPIKLNPDLKSLLTWVTSTIIPYQLMGNQGQDNRMKDLDLSAIDPISPISAGPKRNVRNASSSNIGIGDIGDSSFISDRGSLKILENGTLPSSTRVAAMTAIRSVVCISAEWLQIGGMDPFVSKQIVEMCKVLGYSDQTVRKALMPLFFHLSNICLVNEGHSGLFKAVLMSMRSLSISSTEDEIICQSMTTVLALRDERLLKIAMSTVVHVIRTVVVEAEEDDDTSVFDIPFIDKIGLFMRKVLDCVLIGKRSSLILAQYLLEESASSSVRECMLKEIEKSTTNSPALQAILEKWDAEKKLSAKVEATDEDKENTINEMQIEEQPRAMAN